MDTPQLTHRLIKLGLTEKQAKVYLANLFLGTAPAQRIAEQAGLNRPTTYDILDDLTRYGLVGRSNDNHRTVFVTSGPEGLRDWLQQQANELKQRSQELDNLMPELQQMTRAENTAMPLVRFVHGKEGVDAIWSYVLRKAQPGQEILSITNHDETLKVYPDHLKTNPTIRLSKKLSSKQFYYNSKKIIESDPALLKEVKRLTSPMAADITLYEDKAVLLSYGNDTAPEWSGILIEDKDIVTALRQLFYLAWDNKRK